MAWHLRNHILKVVHYFRGKMLLENGHRSDLDPRILDPDPSFRLLKDHRNLWPCFRACINEKAHTSVKWITDIESSLFYHQRQIIENLNISLQTYKSLHTWAEPLSVWLWDYVLRLRSSTSVWTMKVWMIYESEPGIKFMLRGRIFHQVRSKYQCSSPLVSSHSSPVIRATRSIYFHWRVGNALPRNVNRCCNWLDRGFFSGSHVNKKAMNTHKA